MKRFNTDKAPVAVGPYSQASIHNGIAYISGQIPLHPETNQIISGGIKEQTERVILNIEIILQELGSSLDNVIQADIFLIDMQNFSAVNEVYANFFSANKPSRSCVAVKELPKGAKIEIVVRAAL